MVLFNVMVTEWQEPSLKAELLLNSSLAIRLFCGESHEDDFC